MIDTRAMTADDRQEALFDGEPKQPAGEATIDLDDVPDDDEQLEDEEDDELGGEDEDALQDEGGDTPEPEPVKTRTRGRQPQPAA